jgi:YidC/Oxa1 family membrane protein insertase
VDRGFVFSREEFSVLFRNRKWWTVAAALMVLLVLSGCTPSSKKTMTTDQMFNSGSWWTSHVVAWFSYCLDHFANWFGGSYGLGILVLVVIVRTLILPLMIKQYQNTKAMQVLQPEMKKIREKFKDDPKKQQEEMMKLYQTHQVNPLAGCFPLIIQMPVFIALYNSIYLNSATRDHPFLWLKLGEPDHYYILPVIAAITTFVQSMMMSSQQQAQMGAMKGIMYVYPVLIFVMALSFPSALPLYWIYTNLYTIVQNYFMYARSAKPKPEGKGKEKEAHAK